MNAAPGDEFLRSVQAELHKQKRKAEAALAQVQDADLHRLGEDSGNNLMILVQHMAGNMRSRWTDFLTTDGEKPDRQRDREFERVLEDREAMLATWERGWSCLFDALASLTADDLTRSVRIRDESISVIEAVLRQHGHYAYHVGQIIQLARWLVGDDAWQTLSIPKGRSEEYLRGRSARA